MDGSKFKAVNSRDRNFTPGKIEHASSRSSRASSATWQALDTADRTQPAEFEAKTDRLQDKIGKLREQMRRMDEIKERVEARA